MRRIIVSMNVSLDGFYADRNDGLDWHFRCWTPDMADALGAELAQADTILMGRKTYVGMSCYWPKRWADPHLPRADVPFVEMMNTYRKVVVSGSLRQVTWCNSELVSGDISGRLRTLKSAPGQNIMVYGSGQLVAALQHLGLVDEYQVWLHPVVLGEGRALFRVRERFSLLDHSGFRSGVVLFRYCPDREEIRENAAI